MIFIGDHKSALKIREDIKFSVGGRAEGPLQILKYVLVTKLFVYEAVMSTDWKYKFAFLNKIL